MPEKGRPNRPDAYDANRPLTFRDAVDKHLPGLGETAERCFREEAVKAGYGRPSPGRAR